MPAETEPIPAPPIKDYGGYTFRILLEFASYYAKNERAQQKIVDSINAFFGQKE